MLVTKQILQEVCPNQGLVFTEPPLPIGPPLLTDPCFLCKQYLLSWLPCLKQGARSAWLYLGCDSLCFVLQGPPGLPGMKVSVLFPQLIVGTKECSGGDYFLDYFTAGARMSTKEEGSGAEEDVERRVVG